MTVIECGLTTNVPLCYSLSICSWVFATVCLFFSLYQLCSPSYRQCQGLQINARRIAPFLSFSFYGFCVLVFSHHQFHYYFAYGLYILAPATSIHTLGMYCLNYIRVVHMFHKMPLSPVIELFFWLKGFVFIVLCEIFQGLAIFFYANWPLVIPAYFGIGILLIDLVVTWRYHFKILHFLNLGLNQAVLEKNIPRYTNKLMQLKRSLRYCTVLTLLGLVSLNYSGIKYIRDPWAEPLEKSLILSIGNWIGLMLCCLLVLRLGGDLKWGKKSKNPLTRNGEQPSVNSTNSDQSELDDSSTLVTSASSMPTSASQFPNSSSNVPYSASLIRLPNSNSAQLPPSQTRIPNPSSRVPNSFSNPTYNDT